MKFNRTSYLTRLAALGVATATLIVPLSGVPSAYAQDSYAGSANLQSESQQEIEKAVKNASSKPLTLDELRLNPNVAKILDESKKSSNNNELSSTALVKVIVTLKNQRHLASDFAERANKAKQNDLLSTWKDKYSITVNRQLGYLVNAFEATLPENKIQALQNEPEVASVAKERVYYPLENKARTLEGVTKAFERKHKDLDGRGMLVAIVDTGIDVNQPDMKLTNDSKLKMQPRGGLCGSTEFTEKVPDGYNFADENCNVKDAGKEQHGMHVAGIVAANGKIKGVAPNAQLLAMKVFSNDPDKHGADDADIAAAVEASVKLGADIINMSLGSDNGMSGMSSVTGLALKHALEAGILPVISAGNSGLNFSASGTTDDAFGKWDDGTLGSPAAFNEAFSIASVENSVITASKATYYANNKSKDFVYSIATGSADGGKHEIVYAGLGRTPSEEQADSPDDFKDVDCNGKYVLIQRGEISFKDKFNNAIEKGAAGVIIYNNKPDDLFIGMGGLEKVKIFGASIPMSVGEEIKTAIENAKKDNKKVEVLFSNGNTEIPNPSSLHPSTFTSWGPTPELDFKPHIAGIGGNVWSTQNGENNYIGMSGTSMAAPNVSGLSALVMQSYKNRFPHLSAKALATRVEQALMNTAEVLKNDNGVPYAPRQIGAGLAQVDKAVDTNVIATVDDTDNAYAQLRQVNGPRTISVKLHNIGNSDAQFDIPDNQVINESNEAGQKTVTSFSNESLTTLSKHVRVAPGKTETVKFTLNPKTNGDHYVEGYIGFESTTEGQPNLSVPYLGFVGDWNKEPIIVDPNSTYSADIPATTKLVSIFNEGGIFGNLPMKVNIEGQERSLGAFSPNDDGMLESVKPSIAVLRNAERVNYSVYDKDGRKLVIDLGDDDYLSRTNLGKMSANGARSSSNGTWDGKVWDPKKGFVVAKDGYYTYRIKAQLSKDFPAQEYDMKFALDTTGPTIKISDRDENGDVTFTMHDDLIGTPTAPSITVNGDEGHQLKYDTSQNCKDSEGGHTLTCKLQIDPSAKFIVAKSFDNAFNQTAVAKVFNKLNSAGKPAGSSKIVVNHQDSLTTNTLTPRDYKVKKYGDDKVGYEYYLILSGYLSDDVKSLRPEVAHGKWDKSNLEKGEFKIDSEHATFVAFVPLKNGDNVIKISGLDANGNKIAFTRKFTVKFNEKAPEITVNNLNANKHLDVAKDGKVTIKGKVSDDPGDKLTLKIEYQKVADGADEANSVSDEVTLNNGEFDTTIDPDAKAATVTLVASDGANNTTLTVPLEGRSEPEQENSDENAPEVEEDEFSIDKDNLQEIFKYNYVVSANNPSKDSVKVTGNAGELITSIKFVKNEVGTDKHMNLVVYKAKIDKKKHTFEAELPMHAGLNDFRLEVEKKDSVDDDDDDSTTLVNTPVRFYFDIAAPNVTFNNPTLYGHTLFTNKDSVNLAGEISDDAFGYSLYINGNTVKRFFSIHAGGEGVNKRAFSSDIHVDNGDLINVQSSDQIASSKIGLIPVVLDQEDPTVNIGLLDGEEVKDPDTRKICVKVTDPNLKSVKVYIDNQLVKTEETDLKQTKIEDNMVDTKEVSKIPTDADKPQNTDMKLYIPTAGLKKGDHTLRVEATDYAGNLTGDTSDNAGSGVSRAFTVTQDSTAPAEGSSEPGKKDGSTQTEPEPGKSDGSTQTEPEPGKSDGSTQTEPEPGKSDGSTQTEPEPGKSDGSTQTEPEPGKKDGSTQTEPAPGKSDGSTQTEPEPAPGKNGPTPVTGDGGSTPTDPGTPSEPGKTDPTPVTGGGSTQTDPETPSGSYSGASSSEETGSESSESSAPSAPSAPSFEGIQSDLKVLTVNESNGENHLNAGRMNRFHVKGNDFTDGEHAYAFIYSDPVRLNGEGNNDYVTMHSEEGGYYFDAFIPEGYEGEHTVLLMKGNTQVASAKAVAASETKSSGSSDSEGNSDNDSNESASRSGSRSESRSFTKGSKSRVAHTGVNIVSVMTMIMVLLTGFVSVLSVRMSKVFVSRKADNL